MTPNKAGNRKVKVDVSIPSPEKEQPRYGHIGVIAAVCFAIGVAWPFAAGVRLVPSAPQDDEPKPQTKTAAEQATASPTPTNPPPAAPEPGAHAGEQTIEVEKTFVANCQTKDGKKLSTCDKPILGDAFDARLKSLVSCSDANGAEGLLSLGLKLDFKTNQIVDVVKGKSSSLGKEREANLLACAKKTLTATSLAGVDHQQESYILFYLLRFLPKGAAIPVSDPAAKQTVIPASGSATVLFESAQVREHADPNSNVVVRLLYGTRVFVSGRLGAWYEIKYDSKGHKGFIHKNAIGMQ